MKEIISGVKLAFGEVIGTALALYAIGAVLNAKKANQTEEATEN